MYVLNAPIGSGCMYVFNEKFCSGEKNNNIYNISHMCLLQNFLLPHYMMTLEKFRFPKN